MGVLGSRLSPTAVDVLMAVGVTAVLSAVVTADQASPGPVDPLAYLWAAGLGLLMLARRSAPRVVLALTVLGFYAYYAAGFPAIGVAVPIAAALFSAAEAGHVRAAVVAAVVVLAGSTGFRLLAGQSASYVVGYELVGHAALVAAVIALGDSVRARREVHLRTGQVARLTAHQTMLDAERRAHEERLRLARELHDSMGHSLSVASLYAGVAREAADAPTRDDALGLVGRAVADSMTHLRSTVSLLRSAEPAAAVQPGLADLGRLLEAPAAVGYEVRLEADEVRAPAETEAVAFRVVQESVTNTLRHSDATRISVGVRAERGGGDGGGLRVTVADDGSRARTPRFTPGHGLAGMRERVASLGGELTVTAGPEGWRVAAWLPAGEEGGT